MAIHVAAEPARVFQLARDVARWPELLPHYRRVTVQGRRGGRTVAQMVAMRQVGPLGIPVTWRAETWADDADPRDLRLRFRHIRGVTRGMDVTWHIRTVEVPGGAEADVTIEHDYRRRLPLLGDRLLPWLVDRFVTRSVAGRTLATFKALAEADALAADPRMASA